MLFMSWNKEILKVYTLGVDNRWADNRSSHSLVSLKSIFNGNQVL